MQQRFFQRFTVQALIWGVVAALLLFLTLFILRFMVNQSRSVQLKDQVRIELTQQANLLESDILNQTIVSFGLEAFLASQKTNDDIPQLQAEIERITRILVKRSNLVKHVIVAVPNLQPDKWATIEVTLHEPNLLDLDSTLLEMAKTLGNSRDLRIRMIYSNSQQFLLSVKAVYRQDVLWGYVFAQIELVNLLNNFYSKFNQNAYQVQIEFDKSVATANREVAVAVNMFGQSWLLYATSNDNWSNTFFSLPLFLVLSTAISLLFGFSVYFSRLQYQKANWLAYYDHLTGVGNRRYLESQFNQFAAKGGLGLALFNIDNFRKINETYGFAVGDQILIEVAERLRQALEGRQVLARLGNDEFVVLVPTAKQEELDGLIEEIQRSMSEPLLVNQNVISIITNTGSSLYPLDERSLSGLIERADHHTVRASMLPFGR